MTTDDFLLYAYVNVSFHKYSSINSSRLYYIVKSFKNYTIKHGLCVLAATRFYRRILTSAEYLSDGNTTIALLAINSLK